MVAAIDKVRRIETPGREEEVENIIVEEEGKLFDIKKQVISWMAVQAEADARSQVSCSSRGTVLSENSVSSRGRNRKGETEDQLWERLAKHRMRLDAKKNLCKELVSTTKDIEMLRQEIQNLEEAYSEAAEVARSLRELLPGDEARKMMERVEQEDLEIHQIKRSMVRLMATKNDTNNAADMTTTAGKEKEGQLVHLHPRNGGAEKEASHQNRGSTGCQVAARR